MSPAYTESITNLTDYDDLKIDQGGFETFTLAPEKPDREKEALEKQQAEALEVYREIPREIEIKYGNMVLERVFPELQMDPNVINALSQKMRIKSNVTGEDLTPAEIKDHWILPNGEQVSKSTGAIYIPEKSRGREVKNSFLFWEFENVKKLVDANDPVVPRVATDTERGDLSKFEQAYLDTGSTEGSREEIEPGEADNIRVSKTTGSLKHRNRDTLYATINEPYIPRHPETQQDVFKITRSKTNSTLPEIIDGEGSSIAEKTWGQIRTFFPKASKASQSAENMFQIYEPVLISQDLIILEPARKRGPLECMVYAKKRDRVEGDRWTGLVVLHSGQRGKNENFHAFRVDENTVEQYEAGEKKPEVDYDEHEVSLIVSKWLNSLERRDRDGSFVYGYPTAALTVEKS